MNRLSSLRVFLALVLTATTASVNAQDELSKRASWEYPAVESVKAVLHKVLSELGANEAQIQSATANWTTETLPTEMLDLFVNGIASVNGDEEGRREINPLPPASNKRPTRLWKWAQM